MSISADRRALLKGASALGLSGLVGCDETRQQTGGSKRDIARRWLEREFQPSTLSIDAQMEEMAFFIKAAEPLRGQEIYVASETIPVHTYESRVLARAFTEITGINIVHDLLDEGLLVKRIEQQMLTGRNLYDAYINDSDFVGTHFRYESAVSLTDWMKGPGAALTLPTLDLDDFIGLSFTTGPDDKLYQLPDQQFANLYWFRHDWFSRPQLRDDFKRRYGYTLGVPRNWRAYQDIAEFFTRHVKELDGQPVYGHMDYGKRSPDLGWRFTDAWLSMAGVGDGGYPNGSPVDEWGIRVEACHARGSSVSRGGALNSPAAVYALRKYLEWLQHYAPPQARQMNFAESGPFAGRGQIAQQIFWYTGFTPTMLDKDLPVANDDGTPRWRVAPSPHGAYWQEGMKLGYQDCGAWTLMRTAPVERLQAAWLYAQFTTCKSVSLNKTLIGMTPIRRSDLDAPEITAAAARWGGLVEFYRSPARIAWTPTGHQVPDYPQLSKLWWTRIAAAVQGNIDPQAIMDELAGAQDAMLERLAATGMMERCEPQLNEAIDASTWLQRSGSPKPQLDDEEGQGVTVEYEELLAAWRAGNTMP